ncbi:hypothetical protein UPYG_G00021440 [Umbra pygmaea]|uniref:Coiled-coil domain-containing protein 14 n=1 Tax=Umbra pygmaea TaxID=75934 RepID=A0ABD0XNE1_UMBPY
MTKQGLARHKVISSGRLTGGGRGQASKKRGAGRSVKPSTEPGYSLYSTDSEDQVTTIHKGLDRCAALLNGILQSEKTETKPSFVGGTGKIRAAKPRVLGTLGKERGEAERRKQMKRPVAQTAKKPAPVQKTILSSQSYPGKRINAPSSAGTSESNARFNCRLTTSTPTLSPQRPTSDSTQPPLNPGASVPQSQLGGSIFGMASAQCGASTSTALLAAPGTSATSLPPAPFTGPVLSLLAAQPGGSVYVAEALAASGKGAPFVGMPAMSASLSSQSVASEEKHSSFSPPRHLKPAVTSGSHYLPQTQPQLLSSTQTQSAPDAPALDGGGSLLGCTQDKSALARDAYGHREGLSGEMEEECPVRDISAQTSFAKQTLTQLSSTNPHTDSVPVTVPSNTNTMLSLGAKGCGSDETARHVITFQYLLGELKALLAGQDSVAERLVGELEQTMSLLPVMEGSTNIQAEIALVLQPLRSENALLRRRLRMLNQQLKERERAEREARNLHGDTDVWALQSELNDAHTGLQDLQHDNTELRQALVDTQSQLQHSEAECDHIRKEVQTALAEVQSCNCRLEACQNENAALTLNIQQREMEITTLQERIRALQVSVPEALAMTDITMPHLPLTGQALDQYQGQQCPSDHLVSQYLLSLEQKGCVSGSPPCKDPEGNSTQLQDCVCVPEGQNVHVPGEKEVSVCMDPEVKDSSPVAFAPLKETVRLALPIDGSQHTDMMSNSREAAVQGQRSLQGHEITDIALEGFPQLKSLFSHMHKSNSVLSHGAGYLDRTQNSRRRLDMDVAPLSRGQNYLLDSTGLSLCDARSLASDWSAGSSSTFDTRDEQEFRNGLAALDASIASLQRTIKQDLKR